MMDGLRVVVAPSSGRVRLLPPEDFLDGHEVVDFGQAVALITNGGETTTVTVPVPGLMDGVLVHEGEPVHAGQPLVAIRPHA